MFLGGGNIHTRFDGLSEFISRKGRLKLLEIILDETGSLNQTAKMLNVNRSTVYRWQNDYRRHPSNEVTNKILEIAESIDPGGVSEILIEEASEFMDLVNRRLNEH